MFDLTKKANIKFNQIRKKYVMRNSTELGLFYSNGRKNLGDSVVPWLIERVSGQVIEYSNPLECRGPHLMTIGSILEFATSDCTVWGSGFISINGKPKGGPESVCAVRGPLTATKLKELGLKSTTLYGDPAIALPMYAAIKSDPSAKKIGLIPHYIDKSKLAMSKILRSSNSKFIDIETDNIFDFIASLSECEVVVSSSLHGLIIAETYGIPAIWAEFGDSVAGQRFKFRDYFLSTGRKFEPQDFYSIDEAKIARCLKAPPIFTQAAQDLINEFPKKFKS